MRIRRRIRKRPRPSSILHGGSGEPERYGISAGGRELADRDQKADDGGDDDPDDQKVDPEDTN